MADPRFYSTRDPIPVSGLASTIGCKLFASATNSKQEVRELVPVDELGDGKLAFLRNEKSIPDKPPEGGVVLCTKEVAGLIKDWPVDLLIDDYPQASFCNFASTFITPLYNKDPDLHISRSAQLAEGVSVAWNAAVGDNVVIGAGSSIGACSTIGPGVHIGENCRIAAGVHIEYSDLGDRTYLISGAVLGGRGLGIFMGPEGPVDIPHFGSVSLGDDVTIGANTSIDRGMFKATRIGHRCKIDNQVQIAHNVIIGDDCIMAAQVGISGSCVIGDRVLMGGKAGMADHLTVGDDAVLAAGCVIMKDMPPGVTWSGVPGKPIRLHFRELAALQKLGRGRKKPKSQA